MKKYTLSKARTFILFCCISTVFFSCKQDPETFAIHDPIYPQANEDVDFILNKFEGDVNTVRLYETVSTINSSGTVTATTTETLLQTWSSPSFPITYTKSGGYSANRLVNYRFEVIGDEHSYEHDVTFAIRPYPVIDQPAPVYVVGDINTVMNLLFIPDEDITDNMNLFYDGVRDGIDLAFHTEDYVRRFRSSYNFFINPETGHAHDYDTETHEHEQPSNWDELSFAQGKCIIHERSIRDFAEPWYDLFSAEYNSKGTLLHESGHNFYSLADEYGGGVHWQEDVLPNNWENLTDCENDASGRGMSSSDAHEMGTSGWYKLCPSTCVMETSGTNVHPYEKPCRDRILYAILQRAISE